MDFAVVAKLMLATTDEKLVNNAVVLCLIYNLTHLSPISGYIATVIADYLPSILIKDKSVIKEVAGKLFNQSHLFPSSVYIFRPLPWSSTRCTCKNG